MVYVKVLPKAEAHMHMHMHMHMCMCMCAACVRAHVCSAHAASVSRRSGGKARACHAFHTAVTYGPMCDLCMHAIVALLRVTAPLTPGW